VKRFLVLVSMVGMVSVGWGQQGLVANGGFSETVGDPPQPVGWDVAGTAGGRFEWVNVDGYESSDSLTVVPGKGAVTDVVTQAFACANRTQYVFVAALKGADGCVPAVEIIGAADAGVLAEVHADQSGQWHVLTGRFNSDINTQLRARISATGATGSGAIDAVQIYPVDSAPAELAASDWFTPPGPNIALGRSYRMKPSPRYSYCTDPDDLTQLTDGVYTSGYFWTQKTTVGWSRAMPVIITVDLGEIEPVTGASFNTAAGVAGVAWPFTVMVLVSDDGREWYEAGELVRATVRMAAPKTDGYGVHRFAAAGWKTRGRYVRFMVGQAPYCFVDEVEVYGGDPGLLAFERTGEAFTGDQAVHDELFIRPQITASVEWRLQTDLEAVSKGLTEAEMPAGARASSVARVEALRKQIHALPDAPAALRTVLPLSDLHAAILALNAPVLRARGYAGVTAWQGNRWDALGMMDAPDLPPASVPLLEVTMMRGEVRAEAVNLTNATDEPAVVRVSVSGLPGGAPPRYLSVRDVLFTDTRSRVPVAAALPPAQREGTQWQVMIPAGCTKQLWLSFERPPAAIKAGTYKAAVKVVPDGGDPIQLPLTLHLHGLDFPAAPTLALGGWDYTNGSAAYYRAPGNLESLLDLMHDHHVDTPWATNGVAPRGMKFAPSGELLNPDGLDFRAWDEWTERWHFARNYYVFLAVGGSFQGEKMGTARFNRMVGDWFTAWAAHVTEQGLKPEQVGVLLVDEPHAPEQDEVIIAWSRPIRAVNAGIKLFQDPTYRDPTKGIPEMFALNDILCPNTPMMVSQGQAFRDFYLDQQAQGRTLWLYSCSGPAKKLDPCGYHRGQMWWALRMGATGCFYWALGCGGGMGDSWRAYAQPGTEYAPFFVGQTEVMDGKHMEAIREGVQDYEYFMMLRARVDVLKKRGVTSRSLAAAEKLLSDGPRRVTDTITPKSMSWGDGADHAIMDQVRVEALELLSKLSLL